jgi:hypothetical protein
MITELFFNIFRRKDLDVDKDISNKILKKDALFSRFKKIIDGKQFPITLADLNEAVRIIKVGDRIPEEVKEVFEIAKQLYIMGYFNYRLFTVSSHYGFLAVESALVNKYKAIYKEEGENLYEIIERLAKDDFISADKREIYHSCRHLRNGLSHLAQRKVLTPDAEVLHRAAELINNLYNG